MELIGQNKKKELRPSLEKKNGGKLIMENLILTKLTQSWAFLKFFKVPIKIK